MRNIKRYTDHIRESSNKNTLNKGLLSAAARGNLEEVKFLIDRGANVNAEGMDKWTPLHRAADNGHTEVVRLLLDRGANIAAEDFSNRTPLHLVAVKGRTEAARLLLDRGAQVDAEDLMKQTPLHRAAGNGQIKVTRLLLDRGAQVDAENYNKETPLRRVASNDYTEAARLLEVARLLLLHGADPSKAFDDLDVMIKFFKGDESREAQEAIQRMRKQERSRGAFGRF
jgi:ankyrin repeat protein